MPVNADVVRRKLGQLREAVERLRGALPVQARDLERDRMLEWALERGLQIAAEALFDAGNHILAGEFAEAADEYGQIPGRLEARGVLRAETAARLRSLSGFRNLIVHDYAAIDLQRVVEGLNRLDDFDAFAADIELWLSTRAPQP